MKNGALGANYGVKMDEVYTKVVFERRGTRTVAMGEEMMAEEVKRAVEVKGVGEVGEVLAVVEVMEVIGMLVVEKMTTIGK